MPLIHWILHSNIRAGGLVGGLILLSSACSTEDAPYFPLEEGRWWEYQESLISRDESYERRRIIRNLSAIQRDQTTYYVQEIQGQQKHYYRLDKEGVVRHKFDQPDQSGNAEPSQLQIPTKTDQANWTQTSRLGVIESRTFAAQDRILTRPKLISLSYKVQSSDDGVVVPAGRFTQCLRIQGTGKTTVKVDRGNAKAEIEIEHTDWYAPGVGLIKTERFEKSDSTFLKDGYYKLELLEAY